MKAKTLLFILLALTAVRCKYESLPVIGVITGYDLRKCACCGGLMINFNNKTSSYDGNFYLIDNSPTDLGIADNAIFPIYVEVKYAVLDRCPGNVIHLDSYKKIK